MSEMGALKVSPLSKRAQAFACGSVGLAILSHKGRGKLDRTGLPLGKAALEAPYLSPCGRGYEGRLNGVKLWPKLVRGKSSRRITTRIS